MPQLQIVEDPYAVTTGAAVNNLAGGMMGPSSEQLANYQVLAAKMREADMQQRKLAAEMQAAQQKAGWEAEDRKRMQSAEDAAGRYWGYATPAPVNGTREDMERYYREQNYRDQMARLMARSGKGAEDIAKGFNDYQTGFNVAHPVTNANIPPAVAALGPEAIKKYGETSATNAANAAAKQDAVAAGAGRMLEDAIRARKAYDEGRGYLGPVQSNSVYRTVQSSMPFGADHGETVRSDVENKLAAYQKSLVMQNLPPGPASDKDIEQARKGMASISDRSPEAGLTSIDRDVSAILKNMGYQVPAAHLTELMRDIQAQDMAGIRQFIEAHPGGDQIVRQIYEAMR